MKCLVVDDEQIALEGVADYVDKTPFLELVGKCKNAFEAIEYLSQSPVDLIFLDINMPELSGIDMMKTLPVPPMVIFTTAYSEYALKGFELSAVDYILKPISYDRFLNASQKAHRLHNLSSNESTTSNNDFLYLKVDKKIVKVDISKITYIEGLKDYIKVHTRDESYITYSSLNKIKDFLSNEQFVQVHKSFIVAIEAIEAIDGLFIEIGKQAIPIGRTYKNNLFERVINKQFLKK